MAVKTYKKTDATKLSTNFRASEFACKGNGCCSTIKIDEQLVTYLQKIRNHFKKSVTINSGYRCSKHNKKVGGASSSNHVKGKAADIVVKDVKPAEVAKYAESIGILGIGLYETDKDGHFVHIDTRTKKSFWYGQAQAKRTTFGGVTVSYFKKYTGNSTSIVLALKTIGADSSYAYRKKIASKNSIKLYVGSASQNLVMLNLLKNGRLIKP